MALRQRINTALVAAPIGLALVYLLPPTAFAVLVAALAAVGCWEFSRLANLGGHSRRSALLITQIVILILLAALSPLNNAELSSISWPSGLWLPLMLAGCLGWLLAWSRIPGFDPADSNPDSKRYRLAGLFSALGSMTWMWLALIYLRLLPEGQWWILLILITVWAADSGAYAAGRLFGKRRLAPTISPGKTIAGVVGGAILAPLAAVLTVALVPGLQIEVWAMVVISVVAALASVGGDLYISLHKRATGVKDSGQLFPGHGGVLDRFDSLAAAAPVFALLTALLVNP